MKNKISVFLLACFCFTQACTSALNKEWEPDYAGDRLTVSGFLSPNEVYLKVGKTVPTGPPIKVRDLLAPEGTTVSVLDSTGRVVTVLRSDDRWSYRTQNIRLHVGQAYQVKITAPGLADAETDLITLPDATTVEPFEPIKDIPGANGPGGQLDFSFTDKSPARNFYHMEMGLTQKGRTTNTPVWVINAQLQEKCFNTSTFSDDCFNGRRVSLQYGFEKTFTAAPGQLLGDTLLLRFGQVTHHLFEFEKKYSGSDPFIQGLEEPPLTYTNVKNGYGVVFGQNWKEYAFPLK